jgi:hypothetical protein
MPPTGPFLRSRKAAAGIVLFVASVSWFLIGLGHVWAHPALGWLPTPALAFLAAYVCRRVSRRTGLPVSTRRFWRQFALACGLLGLAVLSNMVDALTGPHPPSQYLSPRTIGLYLAILGIALWALMRLPSWGRSRADWLRFGMDASLVLITTSGLAWHFSFRKINIWTEQTGSAAPLIAIVALAALSLITIVKVAFAGAALLDRRALHILSVNVALSAASGSLSPFVVDRPYLSTTFLAGALAALGVLLAALSQERAPAVPPTAGRPPVRRRFTVVPYLAIAAMSALLISVVLPHGGEDLVVALCAVTVTAVVALRQLAALRENNRLLSTVDAAAAGLPGPARPPGVARPAHRDRQPGPVHRAAHRAARGRRAVPRGAARPRRLQGGQRPARTRHG